MTRRWALLCVLVLVGIAALQGACSPDESSNGGGESEDDESGYDPDQPQGGGSGDDDSGDDDDDDSDDDTGDDDSDDDSDDDTGDDDDTYAPPDGLQMVFLDIGQGDATLIRFPGGSTMLVDGGPNQAGDHVIVPYFESLHLDYLDIMVATHPDADHVGGLDDVIDAVEVGEVWENGDTKDTITWQEFSDAVDDHDIPRTVMTRGDSDTIDGCGVDVLHGDMGWGDSNDKSIVMMIECEGVRLFMTADATKDVDDDLISTYGDDLAADVVKVPHHGSPDHSSALPGYVNPEYAAVSVGAGNPYGHPNATVIEEWEDVGATVFRTDQDGTIVIDAKDGVLTADTEN